VVKGVFMQLSESLKRNIMETSVGRLLNKFKIKSRRDVLFFEEIFAIYIKECEKAGYGEEIRNIAQKWMNLTIQQMTPKILKSVPLFFLNTIMKKVWINIGLLDDLYATKENDVINIETKNESITKSIGENKFLPGLYGGILNILFNSELEVINVLQTKKYSKYVFRLKKKSLNTKSKKKSVYNKLNYLPDIKGFELKDAFQKGIFQLKENNRIYFREKVICPVENTLFHLISNQKILLEKVPDISYRYFKKIIKKDTRKERKLNLLKILLQIMGWGIMKIVVKSESIIIIKITNPPYGLQIEKDNWHFLARMILGYLWLLDKNLKINNIVDNYKELSITYSK
jgi:hypothetical protein